jgi:hypothetical protein
MPRFVILEHDHPHLHHDLMLEANDVLWTWRLPRPPQAGDVMDAERTFDHRLVYLDYEGPISGKRGMVIRREHGEFSWLKRDHDCLEVRIDGINLHAVLRLIWEDGERWRLECD